ncbi:unnamed protein product [Leuciscus chuanchicus]
MSLLQELLKFAVLPTVVPSEELVNCVPNPKPERWQNETTGTVLGSLLSLTSSQPPSLRACVAAAEMCRAQPGLAYLFKPGTNEIGTVEAGRRGKLGNVVDLCHDHGECSIPVTKQHESKEKRHTTCQKVDTTHTHTHTYHVRCRWPLCLTRGAARTARTDSLLSPLSDTQPCGRRSQGSLEAVTHSEKTGANTLNQSSSTCVQRASPVHTTVERL